MCPVTHPPFMVFEGGGADGVVNQHLECGERLTPGGWTGEHRSPRVEAIGEQDSSPPGADAPQHKRDHRRERGEIMSMRHAAPRRTSVATRRPLKRSSEIILAAIIYLTASCFAVIGTLGIVAVVWTLWGAIGVR